jgi:DNA-binding CsgD family transcriptional regulator
MTKKTVLYGILLAVLAIGLKMLEYKFVIRDHALELYGGIIAGFFMVFGIVAGNKFARRKEVQVIVERTVTLPAEKPKIIATDEQLSIIGMSKREYEILQLMAEGMSNQEIAEKLFVSIHTVKTHVSNILLKLDAKRRTQAVIKAKELQLVA